MGLEEDGWFYNEKRNVRFRPIRLLQTKIRFLRIEEKHGAGWIINTESPVTYAEDMMWEALERSREGKKPTTQKGE